MPDSELSLPLPFDSLPQGLRRFCNPKAVPARRMAARGMVPLKGEQLVMVLLQLSADPDEEIATSARESVDKLPGGVLQTAAASDMHGAFLMALGLRPGADEELLGTLVANQASPSALLRELARTGSESLCERIATNQQRLLQHPDVIEALYRNKHTRMSTVDRLVELAGRHGVELTGIHAYTAHVEALQGQLIPEPSDEALPGDQVFSEAAAQDDEDDEEAEGQQPVAIDPEDGTEEVSDKHLPLLIRLQKMNIAEKLRLAVVGNAAARALLVRDPNRNVAMAVIASPAIAEREVAAIVRSREVSDEILRYVANRRKWLRNHEIKHGLVFNPKTPVGISMRFVNHLRSNELRALARSRSVPQPLRTAAVNKLNRH